MAISERPWSNYTEADYPTAAAFCAASLIDLNPSGEDKSKANCKLPVKEPNGALNRQAVHAAAAVLAGGRGGVNAPAAAKADAARKLLGYYGQLKEEPPDSLVNAAGSAAIRAGAGRR